MPDIFGMLVSNPILEKAILEHNHAKGDHTDVKILDSDLKIKESLHQFVVKFHKSKTEINIDFIFNNFRLLINELTIQRLLEFAFNLGNELSNESNNTLDLIKKEYLKYKEKLQGNGNN